LRIESIVEPRKMIALESEWRNLADICPTATVFQTYEWNVTWWRYFGRSFGRKLRLLCFRDTQGALVGLAPLMITPFHLVTLRRVAFLGLGTSDYLDLICAPGHEDAVEQAFHQALSEMSGWDMVDLQQLRQGGLLCSQSTGTSLFKSSETSQEACPYIDLPETWEEYLKSLGKKTRSNISYYDRGLTKVYDVEFESVSDDDVLKEEMENLFDLHQRRWNQRWLPGVFGTKRVQQFHHEVARMLMHKGWLRLFVLRLDGLTQAALYCFSFNGRTCYYQGGFEPTLSKLSLGTVLTARAIHTSIDEGKKVFDFLRGDEPYKAKWTSQSVINVRRVLTRKGAVVDPVVRYTQRIEENIEHRAKSWIRGLK